MTSPTNLHNNPSKPVLGWSPSIRSMLSESFSPSLLQIGSISQIGARMWNSIADQYAMAPICDRIPIEWSSNIHPGILLQTNILAGSMRYPSPNSLHFPTHGSTRGSTHPSNGGKRKRPLLRRVSWNSPWIDDIFHDLFGAARWNFENIACIRPAYLL